MFLPALFYADLLYGLLLTVVDPDIRNLIRFPVSRVYFFIGGG